MPVGRGTLHVREVGSGEPIIVLHGGPELDHRYLLPDMDGLADGYRLVYYDQRGRGLSAEGVRPEDVTLASEMEDLERVRQHLGVESVALLGHSFGALLAVEYAIRHPERVSRLILMNPAPLSHAHLQLMLTERARRWPDIAAKQEKLVATAAYQKGDPDAVAASYRSHFGPAFAHPEDLERLIERLRASLEPKGVLLARQVEERLIQETWLEESYDLVRRATKLRVPTLVLRGDHDFLPEACAADIAAAIPGARYVTLPRCGHFSYMECPAPVRVAIDALFGRPAAQSSPSQ